MKIVIDKPETKAEKIGEMLGRKMPAVVIFLAGLLAGIHFFGRAEAETPPLVEQVRYEVALENLEIAKKRVKKARCDLARKKIELGLEITDESRKICEIRNEKINIKNAMKIIVEHEGFSPTPYPDGDGMSIGYGFDARGRKYMSRAEADAILRAEIIRLDEKISGEWSGNQRAAIVSLIFNLGGKLPPQRFFDEIRNGNVSSWRFYTFSGGRHLAGLKKRREDEISLFFD